jgi:RHS repeat-associated protein
LGNIRLSYSDVNQNNFSPVSLQIKEENNYYPFGLQHKGYNNIIQNSNSAASKFKFIGKEEQDELGLDWLDFGWRNYDPAIGRFVSIDAHAENYYSHTTYNYAGSSPLVIFDLDGLDWYTDKDGNYHFDPDLNEDNADIFFNSKGFEHAKYAFVSNTVNSGRGLNEETNEFEELLTSFTLNADGSVVDNLAENELEVGEIATTAKGTKITAFDEDSYTSYDEWVTLSGETDPSGATQGLMGLGIGATIEKTTTSKVTKNPWFLAATFGVAVAQKQSSNISAWEKSLTPRERKALEKRRKEVEQLQKNIYSGYGGEGRE